MSKIIEKYRQKADLLHNSSLKVTWGQAILESIFNPQTKCPEGKGPMTHLHPNIDKLHLPHGVFIADWRKYRVQDHPMLVEHQKRCHLAGLHDPWLRNYAHNFYPNQLCRRSRLAFVTTGFKHGFCAAVVLYCALRVYRYYFGEPSYKHTPRYVEKYGEKEIFH